MKAGTAAQFALLSLTGMCGLREEVPVSPLGWCSLSCMRAGQGFWVAAWQV
jgi:hypothetical protein